ncbi:MAG: polyketide synthase, partial [Cyanobacteria bacterium J06639_18]
MPQYWQNLSHGVESITQFKDQELAATGTPAAEREHPNYVKARAILENVEDFDAAFFGFTPREAEITDPQHRLFLECAWEALESAGYDAATYAGRIGTYAGSGWSSYLFHHLYGNATVRRSLGDYQTLLGSHQDFLTTRVSYKLNLKGPSIDVQTACSTSLVAVQLACQSLLTYQSDMALAGGVTIYTPQQTGYRYQDEGIFSPDGHCRAFDAQAQGTVSGNGCGIVILKRL